MKNLLSAVILVLMSSVAFAYHCPLDMKKIDAHLATNPELSEEQMAMVTELRAAGESLHNNGQHHASVTVLAKAMEILGIE